MFIYPQMSFNKMWHDYVTNMNLKKNFRFLQKRAFNYFTLASIDLSVN